MYELTSKIFSFDTKKRISGSIVKGKLEHGKNEITVSINTGISKFTTEAKPCSANTCELLKRKANKQYLTDNQELRSRTFFS